MPHKVFANNQLLTAAEVNTYLMRQANIIVANAAERDAIVAPTQGMTVYRLDTGKQERYLAAYHATNNPAGASAAGWYPANRKFVARRTTTQAIGAAGWFVVAAAMTQARNDGLGTFAAGVFTVTAPGTYRIHGHVYLQNQSNPLAIELTKNSASPNTAGSLISQFVSANAPGLGADVIEDLAAGDAVRLLAYTNAANSIDTTGTRGAGLSVERID